MKKPIKFKLNDKVIDPVNYPGKEGTIVAIHLKEYPIDVLWRIRNILVDRASYSLKGRLVKRAPITLQLV